mmetsp:Transcript_24132/g.70796  ORF Transcript_24132/g.70796 Transcript_24132/m.70796 type:complete len:86 (-) Transcript_24132:330-587(-)
MREGSPCLSASPAQSALFDMPSLVVVLVLFICTCTYLRSMKTTLFAQDSPNSFLRGCWKASRVGERLSPYMSIVCVVMALHLVFF